MKNTIFRFSRFRFNFLLLAYFVSRTALPLPRFRCIDRLATRGFFFSRGLPEFFQFFSFCSFPSFLVFVSFSSFLVFPERRKGLGPERGLGPPGVASFSFCVFLSFSLYLLFADFPHFPSILQKWQRAPLEGIRSSIRDAISSQRDARTRLQSRFAVLTADIARMGTSTDVHMLKNRRKMRKISTK